MNVNANIIHRVYLKKRKNIIYKWRYMQVKNRGRDIGDGAYTFMYIYIY